jgi:RHS repeat-associated protein
VTPPLAIIQIFSIFTYPKHQTNQMTSHTSSTQQAFYYPFGMAIAGLSQQLPENGQGRLFENRYLYNGKEYQDDFGLNWYDYGARFYDPQIARFHSIDPAANEFYPHSPYSYVFNNPIMYIDPDGRRPGRVPHRDTGKFARKVFNTIKNAFSSSTPQSKPTQESTTSITREERVREVMTNIANMPQSSIKSQGADIFKVGVSKGLKTKDGVTVAKVDLSVSLNEDKGLGITAGGSVAGDVLSESVSVFPSNESGEAEVIRNFEPNNVGDIPIPGGTANPFAIGRVITRTLEFLEDYVKTKADRTMNPQNHINNEER